MFLLKNQILHKKFEILKNGSLGIGVVKLYKKFHQAAMIGEASNRNQKILSVFAEKSNFARKNWNFEKRAKRFPGDLYSEAV